jgi:N-acetylmuramidase
MPPPVAPPAGPAPDPGAPAGFTLDSLRADDASRLTAAQINAAATSLGVEANALRTVVRVESAGAGFDGGKPLILFEPYWFSQATGGRFDASHPNVSQPTIRRTDLGGTQAARWAKLTEAYALDPAAALGATSWGAFQTPGRYFAQAGYPSVYSFALDVSHSEANQLAAFVAYLSRAGLADELQRRDWSGFARGYEGEQGAAGYATALANAYAAVVRENPGDATFLDGLVAETRAPLSRADYVAAAGRLACEAEAVQAVVEVESGASGFAADGRPIILFEPHIFSRLTSRRFDASNPNVSYPTWDRTKYPGTQAGRWAQLREAYALDPEAAVASASWGRFQIMGMNYQKCGFTKATDFVADMAKSEVNQLKAFEGFVNSSGIADELQRLDWEGFARVYNGSGQVERYGRLMREAYNRLKATS